MKIFRNEDGQTLIFTALLMCVLMGFMALAIDLGVIFHTQRQLQTAADAAATAAAMTLRYSGSASSSGCGSSVDTVTCAAQTAAKNNGVSSNYVTVNLSAVNGWHTGPAFIEVLIAKPAIVPFLGAFSGLNAEGGGHNTMTVAARAVAGYAPAQNCMTALDKTAKAAVDVSGNAVISTPNCSVQDNSSSQQALCTTGNATITSIEISIVGAQSPQGKCNGTQGNAVTGVAPVPDPFAGLSMPTCDGNNTISATTINSTTSLKSETQTFGSGASQTTATVHCFSGSNVTIANGTTLGTTQTVTDAQGNTETVGGNDIFVFQNGVQIGGTVTINGTLDDAGGSMSQGNYALTINAPANSGYTYNGLALVVPASNTSNVCGGSYSSFAGDPAPGGCLQIQFGSGYGNLLGMIYAPNAAIYMQDNGGGDVVTGIIADEIYDKSSNLEVTDNYSHVFVTSPLNHVALVE